FLSFSSFSLLATESLESKYEALSPYHDYIRVYMPVKDSKGDLSIELEDNSKPFNDLLRETKRRHNVKSSKFLSSPLGKRYQSMKNFMEAHQTFMKIDDRLKSCKSGNPWSIGVSGSMRGVLDRVSDNVLAHTERENPEGCGPLERESILGDKNFGFISRTLENQLENELLLDALQRSLEAHFTFARRFGLRTGIPKLCRGVVGQQKGLLPWGKKGDVQGDVCSDQDKALLREIFKKQIAHAERPGIATSTTVANDLSSRLERLNPILESYNLEKKKLKEQWKKEDDAIDPKVKSRWEYIDGTLPQKKKKRKATLKRLKKQTLDDYQRAYRALHSGALGNLLQTDAVKKASGIEKLEELRPKALGLFGSQEKVLKDVESDLPLLSSIDTKAAEEAMEEAFLRTKSQVQDLLERRKGSKDRDDRIPTPIRGFLEKRRQDKKRRDNLVHLMTTNPASVREVLTTNPSYADTICSVTRDWARGQGNRKVAKVGTYIVMIGGTVAAAVASAGLGTPAVIGVGAGAAGVFAGVDYAFEKGAASKNRRLQAAALNAYLSEVGDDKSIEQIREYWKKSLEQDQYAKIALGFLGVDTLLFPLGTANRGGRALLQSRKLFHRIATDKRSLEVFKKWVLEGNNEEKIKGLLTFTAKLPKSKQDELLRSFEVARRRSQSLDDFLSSRLASPTFNRREKVALRKIMGDDAGIDPKVKQLIEGKLSKEKISGFKMMARSKTLDNHTIPSKYFENTLKDAGFSKEEIAKILSLDKVEHSQLAANLTLNRKLSQKESDAIAKVAKDNDPLSTKHVVTLREAGFDHNDIDKLMRETFGNNLFMTFLNDSGMNLAVSNVERTIKRKLGRVEKEGIARALRTTNRSGGQGELGLRAQILKESGFSDAEVKTIMTEAFQIKEWKPLAVSQKESFHANWSSAAFRRETMARA
ncbi:MAG: hypothetical protein OXB88_02465, partial [Bacteriovoracales bacterium]|nr:hypothetical protein [Bacteriovoracales bacterium]